jgi:hypothetical protein
MEGWIKLHRCLLHNPLVMKDADYLAVWCYLLLKATHSDYSVMFGGKKIILKPGQYITGRKKLSSELHINESKIRRILNDYENDQQLNRQVTNKATLITIVNWELYQDLDGKVTNKRPTTEPTSDQQVTTKQEGYKNKKNNNVDSGVRVQLEESFEDLYQRYRSLTNSSNGKGDAKKIYIDYCTKGYKGTKLTPEQIEECFANYIQENTEKREREGWAPPLKNIDTLMRHVTDYKGDENDNG